MKEAKVYGSFQEMLSIERNKNGYTELAEATKNSKGYRVELIAAIDTAQVFNLPITNKDGKIVYRPVRFYPGKEYNVPKKDVALLDVLKQRGVAKKAYSESLEKHLKESGVPYEVIKCKSCGGRVRKLVYNRIEVRGDE